MADLKLHVEECYDIPLREVSGICVHREVGMPATLVAIGDDSSTAVWAREQDSGLGPWHRADLAALSDGVIPRKNTQTEAITADAAGRLLVLIEEPSRVLIFNTSGEYLLAIDLIVPMERPLAKAWRKHPNSRGEGLALLADGRLLVAKEKKPPAFMEFGPAGAEPLGAGPDRLLGPGDVWDPPPGPIASYEALAVWRLDEGLAETLRDISDLAVTEQRHLYVLSDKSRRVVRMNPLPAAGEGSVTAAQAYEIVGKLQKPEGLALLGNGKMLIALDTKHQGYNLLQLGG